MKRISYESPTVRTLFVTVEQGIALSTPTNVQGSHEDVNIGTEY